LQLEIYNCNIFIVVKLTEHLITFKLH
jgi:hypothetical protein